MPRELLFSMDIGAFENRNVLSTQDLAQLPMTLYPNPVADYVQIGNIDADQIKHITFYSSDGQVQLTAGHPMVDVSPLRPGIYLVAVQTQDTTTLLRLVKL